MANHVTTYRYAEDCPASPDFHVSAEGKEVFAYHTTAGDFAAFGLDGAAEVEVRASAAFGEVRVAPARHGVRAAVDGNRLSLHLERPMHLAIESAGIPPLYLYVDAPDAGPPPDARGARCFGAGRVHDVGELRLGEGETLYIEGGAVVRGCVRATSASNVRIAGRGVLDGSCYRRGPDRRRSILLEGCRDSRVDGIIMIKPSAWMLVLGACQDVVVGNVKQLGDGSGSDGIDVVGSRRVRVENCFCRNGDDCVVVKAIDVRPRSPDARLDYGAGVEDVEVVGCTLASYGGGQALEIGHELRTDSVRDIRFRDCDILAVHQYGAAFGIHNADRAVVSDVLYEDIRVEHHYDKLVDFRIVRSRWSRDERRGQVRGVTLRNIDVAVSEYNPGYTVSVIGGLGPEHAVENVLFENFRLNGRKALSPDDFDLYLRHAPNVRFR